MRQAGDTMWQAPKHMFDLKTRAYVEIPVRDASDTLECVHVAFKRSLYVQGTVASAVCCSTYTP